MARKPKLALELIPLSCWERNLRRVVSDDTWKMLREKLAPSDRACPICRCELTLSALELHELWQYDDRSRLQRLVGLQPLCQQCHGAKHFGWSRKVGKERAARRHLMAVNRWSETQLDAHIDRAFETWGKRSGHLYDLDLALAEEIVGPEKVHMSWLERNDRRFAGSLDAHFWAIETLASKEVVILDTETTGLLEEKLNVEAVQIAVINARGRVLMNELVRPKYKIPKSKIKIHGIDNEMVASAPTFDLLYPRLQRILHDKTVIAYKASFDREVLRRSGSIYGLPEIEAPWQCAMWAYKAYREFPKLVSLPGSSHDALADCRALRKLLKRMASNPAPFAERRSASTPRPSNSRGKPAKQATAGRRAKWARKLRNLYLSTN